MLEYTPRNWFWIIGNGGGRYWSSAAGAYVAQIPDGAGLTRIANEQELTDVLAAYRLPGPIVEMPVLQPYHFFAMLEISGKKAVLDAFIDALPAPQNIVARAKLDRSLAFHRDNDLVLAAQQALGLTTEQLDALWTQAAAL